MARDDSPLGLGGSEGGGGVIKCKPSEMPCTEEEERILSEAGYEPVLRWRIPYSAGAKTYTTHEALAIVASRKRGDAIRKAPKP